MQAGPKLWNCNGFELVESQGHGFESLVSAQSCFRPIPYRFPQAETRWRCTAVDGHAQIDLYPWAFLDSNVRLGTAVDGFWRKGWDSNPRTSCPVAGFQDRCLKPLGHPSKTLNVFVFSSNRIARIYSGCYRNCYPTSSRRFICARRKASSTRAAASSCMPGRTWLYKSNVMPTFECPSRSDATFGWTPLASRWVA